MTGRSTYAEAVTIGDLLLKAADRTPAALALVAGADRLTYGELAEQALVVARGLIGLGVAPGDHVGILMPNGVDFVATFFGAALAGAVLVPMNVRYKPDELGYVARDGDLRVIVTNDAAREHVDLGALLRDALPGLAGGGDAALALDRAPELRWVVDLGETGAAPFLDRAALRAAGDGLGAASERRRAQVRLRGLGALLYTSGTTARPKACKHTHESLVRSWVSAGDRLAITGADRCWDPLPLFHGTGYGPMMFTLGAGGTFVTDAYFDAGRALDLIEATRPTFLYPGFPAVTSALIDHPRFGEVDFGAVRALLAIAPEPLWRRSQAAFPEAVQLSGYGLAEAGGIVAYTALDDTEDRRARTCGLPLPGLEVRIADRDTGEALPPGGSGEILVRGPMVFDGYHKDPDKTAEVLDPEGFCHTGDLGTLDGGGCLSYAGRIKDMLKVGGENVAAAEIESCLMAHPAVVEAQVVALPDDRLGEVVAAFVELRAGEAVTEQELVDHCAARMARFKVPRVVRLVGDWPRSATKIQKHRLRQWLLDDGRTHAAGGLPRKEAT